MRVPGPVLCVVVLCACGAAGCRLPDAEPARRDAVIHTVPIRTVPTHPVPTDTVPQDHASPPVAASSGPDSFASLHAVLVAVRADLSRGEVARARSRAAAVLDRADLAPDDPRVRLLAEIRRIDARAAALTAPATPAR